MKTINKQFYLQNAEELAVRLLGKLICVKDDLGNITKKRITETECYVGENDSACHAFRGKTKRNQIMYNEGGFAYIYLCYGIHLLLNIISGKEGHPEGVLIRGIDGATGPGRVSKALNLNMSFNGENLCQSTRLWLEDDQVGIEYKKAKRVGIDYANDCDKERLWRFIVTKF